MEYATKLLVAEAAWPFIVNGEHWLTVICTPTKLEYFVLGFLYNEGLINNLEDVLDLQIGQAPEEVIRVELKNRNLLLPQHHTLTSGCAGGITFVDLAVAREPVHSLVRTTAGQISVLMTKLMKSVSEDYRRIGGFHTTGLSDGQKLLVIATDIGRHNTLDKVAGECLVRAIPMDDKILLTTGRVSTEMIGKAARMRVPIVATVKSPSSLAVELARAWNITLIGYVRGKKVHVYAGWGRIQDYVDSLIEKDLEPIQKARLPE